ncbi:hypothetical protein [Agromyces humi]|uniref:hypothetical protein n=1 Tax=Agromyces humi TaxID=1766800 RepID=UPI00135C3437|nr:hypothetical protein [Agromyces humi]
MQVVDAEHAALPAARGPLVVGCRGVLLVEGSTVGDPPVGRGSQAFEQWCGDAAAQHEVSLGIELLDLLGREVVRARRDEFRLPRAGVDGLAHGGLLRRSGAVDIDVRSEDHAVLPV